MTNSDASCNLLLESLHEVSLVDYDPHKGIRQNKEEILASLGFSRRTTPTIEEDFSTKENPRELERLINFARKQLASNRYLSLLVMREAWQNSGGCPVIYILDNGDLANKIRPEPGSGLLAIAQGGDVIHLLQENSIRAYSRRRSIGATMAAFDNYPGKKPVRLGGGFRLQIDNVRTIGDCLTITCSGVFSFDDMGSRVLALASEDDERVPRVSMTFDFRYKGKRLHLENELHMTSKEIVDAGDARLLAVAVVGRLIRGYGRKVCSLIRRLLSVMPAMGIHQIEGIYGFADDSISVEVIDFDGVDSLDSAMTTAPLELRTSNENVTEMVESIVGHALREGGFLKADPTCLREFIRFRNEARLEAQRISEDGQLTAEIRNSLLRHTSEPKQVFTRASSGPVKLARLLRAVGIASEGEVESGVAEFQFGNSRILLVEIMGYELAYLIEGGKLVDTSSTDCLRHKLSELTGKEVIQAHLEYIREGE